MKCKCCGHFYNDQDDLHSVFRFSDCCPDCNTKFQPRLMVETFPTNQGTVDYHYLFDQLSLSRKTQRYLNKHLSIIYETMQKHQANYDLFICFDDQMKVQIKELSWVINAFQSVFLWSLSRKEIIYSRELF